MNRIILYIIWQVTYPDRFWGWMEQYFIPNIYAGFWYNGAKEEEEVYIGNKKSILLGMPRLRQVRVKESKYILDILRKIEHSTVDPLLKDSKRTPISGTALRKSIAK